MSLQEIINNLNEAEREDIAFISSQNSKNINRLNDIDKDITSKFKGDEMLLRYPNKYINDIKRLLNEYNDILELLYTNTKTQTAIFFNVSGDELEKQTNDNFILNYSKYSNRVEELYNEFTIILNDISPSANPPSANPPETKPYEIDTDEIDEVGTKKGDKYIIKRKYKGYFIKALFELSADKKIKITMTNKELAKMFGISDKTISKAMKPDEIDYKDKHRLKLAKKFIEHYNILDLLS